MIGFLIGRRYKSINLLLHCRPWWFGRWVPVKFEMGPPEVWWTPEVVLDLVELLEERRDYKEGS